MKGQGLIVGVMLLVAMGILNIAFSYGFSPNEQLMLFLVSIVAIMGGVGIYAFT